MELVEAIPHLMIIWVLWLALKGAGGFLEYSQPMIGISYAMLVLTGVHALVILFRRESLGFGYEFLLPLPFLLLALLHYLFLSPAPWAAALGLCGLVQAYALYLVAFNSIKGRQSSQWLLFSCEIVVIFAVLAGFRQFYMNAGGMMLPGRVRYPEYAEGMAGYLQDPQTLASLILLIWPLTVMIAWMRRFPVPVRILNGFCSVIFPIGLLLSANRLGLLVFAFQFLALPMFLTRENWLRRRFWGYGLAVLALSLGVFWYGTQGLRERIQYQMGGSSGFFSETSFQTGWNMFLDAPLFGQGFGSYGLLWDRFNSSWAPEHSVYSGSTILDLLAEFGVVGLILVMVPFLVILPRALRSWRSLPHISYDQDIIRRLKYLSPRQRSRNKLARAQSRTSSSKIILGGLLLGMVGLVLSQLADYSLKLPLHLFIMCSLFACFAIVGMGYKRDHISSGKSRLLGMVPLGLSLSCCLFGVSRFEAQHLYYTANEQLQGLNDTPERIFDNPGVLIDVEERFTKAVDLNPGHAEAWNGLAQSRLAHLLAEQESPEDISARAEKPLHEALRLSPLSWEIHYSQARVALISGKPVGEAMAHLRRAGELSPRRPEPEAFLGILLLVLDRQSVEGQQLVDSALEKYPDYTLVLRLQAWLELSAVDPSATEDSLVTPASIARQFRILPVVRERIRGAGLPAGF